jgi:putative MATE family efflux protein
MVAMGFVRATYLVMDTYWVGHLGADALAAVSAAAFAWWMTHHLCELPAVGVHARVAYLIGNGQRQQVGSLVVQAAAVGALVTLVATLAVHVLGSTYLSTVGLDPGHPVHDLGHAYLTTLGLGSIAFVAHGIVAGVLRGAGHMQTALVIHTIAGVLNAVLDPVFIWGLGPIPAMGIAGAGWATVCGAALAALLGTAIAVRRDLVPQPVWQTDEVGRLISVGAPITLMGIAFSLVYVVLAGLVVPYGEAHLAALGVGHRIESFPFLTAMGFTAASTTLIGQRYGAGDLAGVASGVRTVAGMCCVAMLGFTAVGLVAAEGLYSLFSDEPEIVAAGVVYLLPQACVWTLMGLEMAYEGCFTGLGRTLPAMWISGVLTAARIPMAWWLAGPAGWGITGIWVAIAVSTLIKGIGLAAWFHLVTLPSLTRHTP